MDDEGNSAASLAADYKHERVSQLVITAIE